MRGGLNFDAVVIGAGTAGLTAAIRLAQGGAQVCVLAKGIGSTHLAAGTIDVLGYAPDRVSEPRTGLAELTAERPDHPYALLGPELIGEALAWLQATAADGPLGGYGYVGGGLDRNGLYPSALGGLRPSALVPTTMAAGEADGLRRVCIVGTPSLRDFHARLCASNLSLGGIDARAVEVELELDRADANTLGIARRFDDPGWRARFCAELAPSLHADEHVGLPAMLGMRDPGGALVELEQRLGRNVFEIPTLPPSVPGMRLYEILVSALRRAGGRLVMGAEVAGARWDRGRLEAVTTRAAGRDHQYAAPAFVLATGGFASGAIELDSRWRAHDRVLGLTLRRLPVDGEAPFAASYFAEQPLARAGIAVESDLRAHGTDNVVVAGAALAGAAPWREHSGEGIALASGFRAAQVVAELAGAPTGRRHERRWEHRHDHWRRSGRGRRGCPVRSRARLARSLREVHDLRNRLPRLKCHATIPRPEVRGTPVRALPGPLRADRGLVGRLLLGLRDLLAGLPARREDRRDQLARPQQAQAGQGSPTPRPDHHQAYVAGSPRHSGCAVGELHPRLPAGPAARREAARRAPRRPGAEVRGPALLEVGQASHHPAHREAPSRLLPWLRHRVLRAVGGREARRDPGAQRLRGRRSRSRIAAGCRCNRVACSTTPDGRSVGSPVRWPRSCTIRTRSSSATRPAAR